MSASLQPHRKARGQFTQQLSKHRPGEIVVTFGNFDERKRAALNFGEVKFQRVRCVPAHHQTVDGNALGFYGVGDKVRIAPGFDWEIPYIKEELLPWERGRIAPPLAIFPDVENLFLISFVESNGSSFSLFNDMSRIIARAILIERDKPQEYQRLRKVLKETEFDVTGGLRMLNTDRHVGYMDNLAYRKALKKLIKMMSWPDEGRPLKPKHGWTSS